MKYSRFEDTPVWQAATALAVDVFKLVEDHAFDRKGDLRDQLQRAALSIGNNIAEGFERGTTNDLIWFLYIARGSAGEVRSMLRAVTSLIDRSVLRSEISDLKSEISELIPRCESISRQIRGWADSLQNSDIQGQRHLNEASKAEYDQHRRTRDFMEKLRRIQKGEPFEG